MHHVQNYFCNEAADPNQEDIFVEEHKKLRKSHTTPCILEKKICTIAKETYNNSVNRNANPNCNPSNSNRIKKNWWSTPKCSTNPHGRNPLDRYGMPAKSVVCQSINHWAQDCPDKSTHESNSYILNGVVLHQTHYHNPQELKFLMSETWSAALLDCEASKTVCGKECFNQYVNSLRRGPVTNTIL